MSETQKMEIELPADNQLTAEDLAILRSVCQDLVTRSCRQKGETSAQVEAMAAEGWRVQTGLAWLASAERGRESEEAVGDTTAEALCRLCQMTGLHTVDGCP